MKTRNLGVALAMLVLAGCTDQALPPDNTASTTMPDKPAVAPKFDRKPEVLLSSRKTERLIVAIDFAGSPAMDKSIAGDERRKYVLEQVVALYTSYAKKEAGGQKVRIMALCVPNRDDYARGDFRNMDELAICDTDHATATDTNKSAAERAGQVEWRAGFGS